MRPVARRAEISSPRGAESRVGGIPQGVVNDSESWGGDAYPFGLGAVKVPFHAPAVALPKSPPDDLTAVQLAVEDLAHRGWRPRARPSGAPRHRRQDPLVVQRDRDAPHADASGTHLKDAAHHSRLGFVDDPFHVRATRSA